MARRTFGWVQNPGKLSNLVIGYVNGEYPKTSLRRENRVFYVE